MSQGPSYRKYFIIWLWLVGLMLASVALSALPMGKGTIVLLIFTAAAVKAVLVALYFMHLKFDHLVFSLIALTPVVLFVILTLTLFPDFVS